MKITFNDFLNEYSGPGKRIGFNKTDEDTETYNIIFDINNNQKSVDENTDDIKAMLSYYDVDYTNFKSSQIETKNNLDQSRYSFDFKSYDEKERDSIIKHLFKSFSVIANSIDVIVVLPWQR